jgi:hypothetical protein
MSNPKLSEGSPAVRLGRWRVLAEEPCGHQSSLHLSGIRDVIGYVERGYNSRDTNSTVPGGMRPSYGGLIFQVGVATTMQWFGLTKICKSINDARQDRSRQGLYRYDALRPDPPNAQTDVRMHGSLSATSHTDNERTGHLPARRRQARYTILAVVILGKLRNKMIPGSGTRSGNRSSSS